MCSQALEFGFFTKEQADAYGPTSAAGSSPAAADAAKRAGKPADTAPPSRNLHSSSSAADFAASFGGATEITRYPRHASDAGKLDIGSMYLFADVA